MELFLQVVTNSEYCQTSKMELFTKIVKNEKPFTIFVKPAIELASKVKDVSFLNINY